MTKTTLPYSLLGLFIGCMMTSQIQAENSLPSYASEPGNHVKSLVKQFQKTSVKSNSVLIVDISDQVMHYYKNNKLVKTYKVSTSKYGIGNKAGTNQTPLGVHYVKQRFGNNAKIGTIFKGRRNTGQLAEIITDDRDAKKDYVTTRILWLRGLEKNINRGSGIDSYQRYIYIHGTPEEGKIGRPASHGCIRMYNKDVIELYSQVSTGTLVNIIR